jgi:DNA-directed RNA polymerase subunit H (RpoH/RPB5)
MTMAARQSPSQSFATILEHVLVEESYCDSKEEAKSILDTIDLDCQENNLPLLSDTVNNKKKVLEEETGWNNFLEQRIEEYLGVSKDVAMSIVSKGYAPFVNKCKLEDDSGSASSSCDSISECELEHEQEGYEDDDDSFIGEGACELCERENIRLTRHHMIPKSTYKRIEPRILRSASIYLDANATTIATHGKNVATKTTIDVPDERKNDDYDAFANLISSVIGSIPSTDTTKRHSAMEYQRQLQKSARMVMKQQTIDICRSCHNMIHRTHDNITLAINYNTIEKLLRDEAIYKYCRWANKQKYKPKK